MRAPSREELLAAARPRLSEALGEEPQRLRVVGYRPRTGAILCDVASPAGRLFGKVFLHLMVPSRAPWILPTDEVRDEVVLPAAAVIDREWGALEDLSDRLGTHCVPVPVARSAAAMLCGWVDGRSLEVAVMDRRRPRRRGSPPTASMRAAGRWLRALHDSDDLGTAVLDLGQQREALAQHRDRRPANLARQRHRADRLLQEAADRLGTDRVPMPRAPSHGDFSLPNLIMAEPAWLVATDLEHFGTRSVLHDLAVFTANLRAKLVDPRYPVDDVIAWEQAFWAGYGDHPPELRLAIGVVATVWVRIRFAHRKLRSPWWRIAAGLAALSGRGFRGDLLERVTWRLADVPGPAGASQR